MALLTFPLASTFPELVPSDVNIYSSPTVGEEVVAIVTSERESQVLAELVKVSKAISFSSSNPFPKVGFVN